MQTVLREEQYVILELGSYSIRGHKGVQDLLTRGAVLPAYTARCAVKSVDESLGEPIEDEGASSILVGAELDAVEAAGGPLKDLRHPIQRGRVVDWEALEIVMKDLLVHGLKVKRQRNESPMLLAVPESFSFADREKISQIVFEKLNAPGLLMVDQPLCALYGENNFSGMVIDIGHETIDIVPVIDTVVQSYAAIQLPMGGKDLEECFLKRAKASPTFMEDIGSTPVDLALIRSIKESGECSLIPAIKGKATATPEKQVEIMYKDEQVTVGKLRHTMAEPFFLPYQYGYTGIPSLPLAVFTSLSRLDSERRSLFRERVLLTGGSSRFPGLAARLELELRALVPTPESGERVESILFTRIPKCFSDWQDANSFPALLGGSILAKSAFGDSRNYITKSDYNDHGPAVVRTKGSA